MRIVCRKPGPFSDEEIAATRADPDQIVFGPMDIKWRIDDPELSNLM
jgi:hypothetical protein